MKKLASLFTLLSFASIAFAEENTTIPLWPDGAPGFEDKKDVPERAESYWVRNVHNPSITEFQAHTPSDLAATQG